MDMVEGLEELFDNAYTTPGHESRQLHMVKQVLVHEDGSDVTKEEVSNLINTVLSMVDDGLEYIGDLRKFKQEDNRQALLAQKTSLMQMSTELGRRPEEILGAINDDGHGEDDTMQI